MSNLDALIGLGTDCEEVSRFEEKPYGKNSEFYQRFFSSKERDYCLKFKDASSHFAGLFTAKEAIIKAMSDKQILTPNQIEISHDKRGKPTATLQLSELQDAFKLQISISHTSRVAMAVCIMYPVK